MSGLTQSEISDLLKGAPVGTMLVGTKLRTCFKRGDGEWYYWTLDDHRIPYKRSVLTEAIITVLYEMPIHGPQPRTWALL